MNVLVIGSGGRECTLTWKLSQSKKIQNLFTAPGNAGTSQFGKNVNLDIFDFDAIGKFCLERSVDYLLVGPEAPLVAGIYDYFQNDGNLEHITVIGPSREGAQLEGSKAFAKKFMADYGIPTAAYDEYTLDTLDEGIAHIRSHQGPYVLKADGLAAGKGVLIIQDPEEAVSELTSMLEGKFGEASETVVIEAFLDGIEFSVFILTDGNGYVLLPEAKDYKRIGEGDTGLNTGGMGAISPVPFCDEVLMEKVKTRIIDPTIRGIRERKMNYCGFIFFGLIKVKGEPYVIEYNCRMGDPETEVVIPRIESDLADLLIGIKEHRLDELSLEIRKDVAATVMLVSGGYPGSYKKGKAIHGIEDVTDSMVIHAGTKEGADDQILTNGGRVIALTSFGKDIPSAIAKSMDSAEKITFEGKYFRRDIGFDLV